MKDVEGLREGPAVFGSEVGFEGEGSVEPRGTKRFETVERQPGVMLLVDGERDVSSDTGSVTMGVGCCGADDEAGKPKPKAELKKERVADASFGGGVRTTSDRSIGSGASDISAKDSDVPVAGVGARAEVGVLRCANVGSLLDGEVGAVDCAGCFSGDRFKGLVVEADAGIDRNEAEGETARAW